MNDTRYVAFIDILGFKNIVNNFNDPKALGAQLLINFNSALAVAINEKSTSIDISQNKFPKVQSKEISFYQFSDSIILYSNDNKIHSLEKMVRTLNIFMAKSLLKGFPLRGALVKDSLFSNPPIIVGKSIIRAVKLESAQEWSGIVIDSSCFDNSEEKELLQFLLTKKLVCETDVPIKGKDRNEIEFQKHIVINWPQFIGMYISSFTEVEQCFTKYSGKPDKNALSKIKFTIDFLS
ncbi:hypothetical protein ABET52_19365 [Saccharococcus caldoxylosilyticus]|uniref:hypothetical protein n=1 Tax=Saccharococcus caldoxylosilyticus TaxID=81408 RepID=UPI003D329B16